MNKIPVLLDTDIGSDIDDAVALAYLLRQPRCELLGVTTVTGKPQVRAQLVDAVCRAFDRREVPIFSGAAEPILNPQPQTDVPQESVLPGYEHRDVNAFAPNAAVDFLRETIRSRPGEITLLSVGPLTNVGLLYALDPEIPRLLKRHVMMAGLYGGRLPHYGLTEWNAKGDPHATAVVFRAKTTELLCVGLDVTTRCQMPADECRKRFSQGALKIVGEMAEEWFKKRPSITFHDPLAAAAIFEPTLLTYDPGRVNVELQSESLKGLTDFDRHAEHKPHHVAVAVQPDAFFKHYFDVVSA